MSTPLAMSIKKAKATKTSSGGGHRTAQHAVQFLLEADSCYRCPSRTERQAMLVGYAKCGKVLHGAAFDLIRTEKALDLEDPDAVANAIEFITICEIKSTNQAKIKNDLKGYFFNITAGEMLTAQSVGERYRFIFLNTQSGEHQEMSLNEVFGRSRAMYPAWHIRF